MSDLVSFVVGEISALRAYLDALPADVWERQSRCDAWRVSDVVAHVARGTSSYTEGLRAALRGDVSLPVSPPGTPRSELSAAVAERTRLARAELVTRDQVLQAFHEASDDFVALISSLSPSQLALPCWHRWGVITVERLVAFRGFETCVHLWDIQWGVEPEPRLTARCRTFLFRWLEERWYGYVFRPQPALPASTRFRWELAGAAELPPGAVPFDVVVLGDSFRVERDPTSTPDVTYITDLETYDLLGSGRLSLDTAIAARRLSLSGQTQRAAHFFEWFAPI